MVIMYLTLASAKIDKNHIAKSDIPNALVVRALRFRDLAVKGDLKGLSHICAGKLECFDITRLTPREVQFGNDEFMETPFPSGKSDIGYELRREVVVPGKLNTWTRSVMTSLCQLVRDSSQRTDYIKISSEAGTNQSLIPFSGRGLSGKIVSNAYWRVDFEETKGEWIAVRFILFKR